MYRPTAVNILYSIDNCFHLLDIYRKVFGGHKLYYYLRLWVTLMGWMTRYVRNSLLKYSFDFSVDTSV
jgi:hypothetical protein